VCGAGERCLNETCVPACPIAPCKEGERKCISEGTPSSSGYQVCEKNAQGCLEWSSKSTRCGTNERCERGQCQPFTCPEPVCQEGELRCLDKEHFRICGRDNNKCIVWLKEKKSCEKGKRCFHGQKKCLVCQPKISRKCYSGKPGTEGKAHCRAGIQICKEDGSGFGPCLGEAPPKKELCNNKDDDCDGLVDNGFPTKGKPCVQGVGECRTKGKYICGSDGKAVTCKATIVIQPKKELCNDKDDDCDGKVDETLSRACYGGKAGTSGVGICKSGAQHCQKGKWTACSGEIVPAKEVCDGKDNDCNGKIDDTLTVYRFYPDADGDGFGDKKKQPVVKCVFSAPKGHVNNNKDCNDTNKLIHPKAKELCDGLDNNCSGIVDDNSPILTWYPDTDGDGFGDNDPKKSIMGCVKDSLTICTGLNKCQSSVSWTRKSGDCCDKDAHVKPGQSQFFSQKNKCGSFDYNCDGKQTFSTFAPVCTCSKSAVYSYSGDVEHRCGTSKTSWWKVAGTQKYTNSKTCELNLSVHFQPPGSKTCTARCAPEVCKCQGPGCCSVACTDLTTKTIHGASLQKRWLPRAHGHRQYIMWHKNDYRQGCLYRIDGKTPTCGDVVLRAGPSEKVTYAYKSSASEQQITTVSATCSYVESSSKKVCLDEKKSSAFQDYTASMHSDYRFSLFYSQKFTVRCQ